MPAKTTKQSEDIHNPYGYTEMDWAAQLDPAYAAARAEVRRLSVGEESTLSVKVKEFVVMGVLASRGLQSGWRPTCAGPSSTAPPRRNCLRPSKPPPSLVVAWPTVWGSGRSKRSSTTGPSHRLARRLSRVVSRGKPPHNRAPPALHHAGGAPPPRGDGAGHVAPSRCPPSAAHCGGHLTAARVTRLLYASAFSGSVPRGIVRAPPCGGAVV